MERERTSEPPMPLGRNSKIGLLIKLAISLGILGGLGWKFRGDLPSLRDVDLSSLTSAVLLLLLQPLLIGLRWWFILRLYDGRSSARSLVEITWISVFANQFLPASVGGDAVRVFAARQNGERLGAAAASVVVDRLVALLALAMLVVTFGIGLRIVFDTSVLVALGVLCLLAICGAIVTFRVVSGSTEWAARWPAIRKLVHLVHYVLRIVSSPATGFVVVGLAILVHLISFVAFLMIARGIGISTGFLPFMSVAAVLAFVQVVPISMGGWGVREAAAVSLLGLFGVDQGSALLASLLLGLCYAAASLPGAAIWPFQHRRSAVQPVPA